MLQRKRSKLRFCSRSKFHPLIIMNLKHRIILGLGLISFWLAGCATCETPETNYAAYRTDDLLELVGVQTNSLSTSMSGDMLRKNDRRYTDLRRRADLVIQYDGQELEFISSKIKTNLPKGKFPVEDLENTCRQIPFQSI